MKDDFGVNASGDHETPCLGWFADYTLTLSVIYGIAILITVINTILQKVLYTLAFFERPHNQTEQLQTATQKSWTIMFVQTALVLVIINAYYKRVPLPENSPVLRGNYPDFNPEWYTSIGATIVLTALINAVMPPMALLDMITVGLKRCCDRGCEWHSAKTSQIL